MPSSNDQPEPDNVNCFITLAENRTVYRYPRLLQQQSTHTMSSYYGQQSGGYGDQQGGSNNGTGEGQFYGANGGSTTGYGQPQQPGQGFQQQHQPGQGFQQPLQTQQPHQQQQQSHHQANQLYGNAYGSQWQQPAQPAGTTIGNTTSQQPSFWNPATAATMVAMAGAGSGISNDAMFEMASNAGKSFLQSGSARMVPGLESTLLMLRRYFAVDNRYVQIKMRKILFPFLDKQWTRVVSLNVVLSIVDSYPSKN